MRFYIDPVFAVFVFILLVSATTTDIWLNDITLSLVMIGTFSALLIYDQLDRISETFEKVKAWFKSRF